MRRPGAPGLYANLLAACARQNVRVEVVAEVERMMTNLNLIAAGVGLYQANNPKNAPLFVQAAQHQQTIAPHLAARESSGNFQNHRRYMWPAAVVF